MRFSFLASLLFLLPFPAAHAACDTQTTTHEINNCLAKQRDTLDKTLKKTLRIQLKAAENADRDMARDEGLKPYAHTATALRESQTAFTAYRTSECARQRNAYTNGSGAGTAYLGCEITLLEQRLEQLTLD